VNVCGLMQAAKAAPSRRHSKPAPLPVKVNAALRLVLGSVSARR